MADSQLTKQCSHCKLTKPISDFHKARNCRLGVKNKCRECCNAVGREYMRSRRADKDRPAPVPRSKEVPTEKYCPRCETVKPVSEFILVSEELKTTSDLYAYCRPCKREYEEEGRRNRGIKPKIELRKIVESRDLPADEYNRLRKRLNMQQRRAKDPEVIARKERAEQARKNDVFRCDVCADWKGRCDECTRLAHLEAIRRWRDRNRSGRPSGAPKRESVSDDELVEKYQSGMSTFQIAETVDMTPSGIVIRLRNLGIQMRKTWDYEHVQNLPRTGNPGELNGNWIELPIDEIIQMYETGMCAEEIARDLGTVTGSTIIKRLRSVGLDVDSSGWGRARTASDGHRVSSSLELAVDDWLCVNELRHTVHPRLPWGTKHRSDFLVDGRTYIEVWGVVNNPEYDDRRQQKVAMYQKHGNALVQVFPDDVLDGLSILISLLA